MDIKAVLRRIERRLAATGHTAASASRAATGSPDTIRNWQRAAARGAKAGIAMRSLESLAPVLSTTTEWLMSETGPEEKSLARAKLDFVAVPLLSWVSAGALALPDAPLPDMDDHKTVYAPDLEKGDWIALRVDGDSMNRISPHDSIIFVDRSDRKLVANACYVIADIDGGATYKRFRPPNTWEPVSTNPVHEPLSLAPGREPYIIGRVRKTILAM